MSVTDSFSPDQRRTLTAVLDLIIPASPDGRLPGAGEVGVADYLDRALRSLTDLRAMVTDGLTELERVARERHGCEFTALAPDQRAALLNEQGFVFPLTLHTFTGYYQAAPIVEALGLEARPPHPGGYAMAPDNLTTLLDPVRRRPKMFRPC